MASPAGEELCATQAVPALPEPLGPPTFPSQVWFFPLWSQGKQPELSTSRKSDSGLLKMAVITPHVFRNAMCGFLQDPHRSIPPLKGNGRQPGETGSQLRGAWLKLEVMQKAGLTSERHEKGNVIGYKVAGSAGWVPFVHCTQRGAGGALPRSTSQGCSRFPALLTFVFRRDPIWILF